MREIAEDLLRWYAAGEPFALATVTAVSGSAPRPPGAALALRADGTVAGSVSGGCVEGAVCQLAEQVLAEGVPVRHRFGYSADDAFAVGLSCGGEIEVYVRRVDPARDAALRAALDDIRDGRPVALATVLDESGECLVVPPESPTGVRRSGGREVFVQSFAGPPRMLVFGAIDFAAAVTRIGKFLGYRVTVCDARPAFATAERFPEADEVVVDWPHRYLAGTDTDRRTVVCVLTHDAKFDVPLLVEALRRPLGYVGAMGSRRTCAEREARLREVGITEVELARLHSPIGLDLGAVSPEETAVSIAAEIVAARSGATARALSTVDGPIHKVA